MWIFSGQNSAWDTFTQETYQPAAAFTLQDMYSTCNGQNNNLGCTPRAKTTGQARAYLEAADVRLLHGEAKVEPVTCIVEDEDEAAGCNQPPFLKQPRGGGVVHLKKKLSL
jgi:hypothetical protein